MTLEPTTAPDRARPGLALLVMASGLAGLATGMAWVSRWPSEPAPGANSPLLAVVLVCLALLLSGAAPGWASAQLLRRPWLAAALPVWSAILGLACWWLLRTGLALMAAPKTIPEASPVPEVVGCGVLVLVLTLASGIAAAAFTMPRRTAVRCAVPLLLLGAPWIALGLLVCLQSPGTEIDRLNRPEPWPVIVLLLAALAVGVGGAAVGHALRRPTTRRALAALLAIGACGIAGWFLLGLTPPVDVGDKGQPLSLILVLLGLEGGSPSVPGEHAGEWSLAYVAAALVMGWAQWSGLLLSTYETATAGVRPVAVSAMPAASPRKWASRPGRVYALLAVLYTVFVIYGSLVPLEFNGQPFDKALDTFLETPYLHLDIQHRADMVANLLLFIPMTFFAMGAWTRENTRPGRVLKVLCLVVLACLLAVAIEFAQVFFPPRTVSLNDIMTECIGGAVGVMAWLLFGGPVTRWFRDLWRKRDPRRLAIHICVGYVIFLAIYELYPFDFVISQDELARQLDSAHFNLMPLADLGRMSLLSAVVKVAMLAPVGYLVALLRLRRARPVLAAALLGGTYALLTEVLRIPVYSRGASTTDILLGTAGAALGGWLAVRFGPVATRPLPQGTAWRFLSFVGRLGAGLGGAAAILWYHWYPGDFQWPREGLATCVLSWLRIPFYYQYYNTEFQATLQLGGNTLALFMLALVFTSLLKPLGRKGRWMAGTAAAVIGVAAEAGRLFFPPRVPDLTTTVFFMVLGAALGVWLYDPLVRIFIAPRPEENQPPGDWLST